MQGPVSYLIGSAGTRHRKEEPVNTSRPAAFAIRRKCALAFAFEKEDYKKLVWLVPQRLIYRQLMYYILFKSFNKAIKGEIQGWGALKRTGNVRNMAPLLAKS